MNRARLSTQVSPLIHSTGLCAIVAVMAACSLNPQPLPPGEPDSSFKEDARLTSPDGAKADAVPTNSGSDGATGDGGAGSTDAGDGGFADSGAGEATVDAEGDAPAEGAVDTGLNDADVKEGGEI